MHSPLPPTSEKPSALQHVLPAAVVGLACALLYASIATGALRGILIGHVPTLLLLGLGWLRGSRAAGIAALVATVALLSVLPNAALRYVAIDALPALIFLRLSLTYFAISGPDNRLLPHLLPAFSTGQILTAICLYIAIMSLLGLSMLHFSDQLHALPEPSAVMLDVAQNMMPFMEGQNTTPEKVASSMLPLMPWIIGLIFWVWTSALWAVAALSHYLAGGLGIPAPRDLSLRQFRVPVWILGALAIVGVGAASAMGWTAIILKSTFFLLLFPYFLSGVAIILPKIPAGPARRWGVAGLLIGLAFFPGAVLIFIAIGLFHPLQDRSSNS